MNGKIMPDCQEHADGRRPDNLCACYHFYKNPVCCERSDCIVPLRDDGTLSSQICGKSEGKRCDPCNPIVPECVAPGGTCVVTNTTESYCTLPCSGGQGCAPGFKCLTVKNKGEQCVPEDFSCYY